MKQKERKSIHRHKKITFWDCVHICLEAGHHQVMCFWKLLPSASKQESSEQIWNYFFFFIFLYFFLISTRLLRIQRLSSLLLLTSYSCLVAYRGKQTNKKSAEQLQGSSWDCPRFHQHIMVADWGKKDSETFQESQEDCANVAHSNTSTLLYTVFLYHIQETPQAMEKTVLWKNKIRI